jgi:HlyD family secretion protein
LPKDTAPGPSLLTPVAWLAVIGMIAFGAYLGYQRFAQLTSDPNRNTVSAAAPATPASATNPSPPPRVQDVSAAANRADGGGLALEAKGYLIPAKQVLISPKVSGMIEKLNVVEGKRFEKGAVLAELEKTEYQADLQHAQAVLEVSRQRYQELKRGFRKEEVEQAQAELGEAQEQLDKATKDWQRNNTLFKSRAISQEEFEGAQSQMRALEMRVERLRFALKLLQIGAREERILAAAADVQQAEAGVTKARWKFDNTVIRAPISGTILKKNSEEGNIVNSIAFNGSYSICDMADLSDMEVELTIQERDISRIFTGQECRVRADAYPDRVYTGHVSRVMPIADRAKGAVPIRVKVDIPAAEEGVYLKPEMGAVVSFLRKSDSAGAKSSAPLQPDASSTPANPRSRTP